MKKTKIHDKRLRNHLKKKEFDLLFNKLLLINTKVSILFKVLSLFKVKKTGLFLTKINNICVITNRARSVYKGLKISRIVLRRLGSEGLIPGLQKSS